MAARRRVGCHQRRLHRPRLDGTQHVAERLVPRRQLHGTGTGVLGQHHRQHLDHYAIDVVLGLLPGEAKRVDLHAIAEAPELGVGNAVAVAANLVPQPREGAQLANLCDQAHSGIDEKAHPPDQGGEALFGQVGPRAHRIEDQGGVGERGGMVVFCAGTTGFNLTFDGRFVWMRQKRIQGSHFANLEQAAQANRLVLDRRIDPSMSEVFSWHDIPRAHAKMRANQHLPGNMAVLVQARRPGMRTLEEAQEAKPAPPCNKAEGDCPTNTVSYKAMDINIIFLMLSRWCFLRHPNGDSMAAPPSRRRSSVSSIQDAGSFAPSPGDAASARRR